MSMRVLTYKVDDLALAKDPGAEVRADQTIAFAVGGTRYEIDLSAENAEKFEKKIAPFVNAARRTGSTSRRRSHTARQQSAAIREWAAAHGKTVHPKGRIPASVRAEYEAASQGAAV
jgi:nucleoid-associated protein Lsr2